MKTINYKFYKKAYDKYGIDAKALHWYSKDTQFKRFEVLSSFIKEIKKHSIIDLGCGFADLLLYFEEKNIKPDIYIGVDCEEFMLDICKKRFVNESFLKLNLVEDALPKADYLLCSGALNILNKKDFLKAIKNCYEYSKKGFIFNFLTEKSLHNLNTEEIYEFCKGFCEKVTISEEYLHNDTTFFLEK